MSPSARRTALALALAASGLGDAAGGLWAVFDGDGVARFLGTTIPDWQPVARASARGLEAEALRRLWANLGTALVALGLVQGVAAWWVREARPEGIVLARLAGAALVAAGLLMAGPGGQMSSLATEALRGAVILGLAAGAAPRPGCPGARRRAALHALAGLADGLHLGLQLLLRQLRLLAAEPHLVRGHRFSREVVGARREGFGPPRRRSLASATAPRQASIDRVRGAP
jgi:hypothetical protein